MLSDEEKKAIEYLKIEYEKLMKEDNILFPLYKSDAKRLIDIIEKQSKEIEKLNKALMTATLKIEGLKIEAVYNDNYISKDKIKAKIEEVDIQLQKLKDGLTGRKTNFVNKNMLFAQKKALQSLLEKE